MCEFCHQHGEGQKWYLNAKNYSEDLLHDLKRQKYIKELFSGGFDTSVHGTQILEQIDKLDKIPRLVRPIVDWRFQSHQKMVHYGQVLPIEDVEQVFGFVKQITRINCICRFMIIGKEARFCYGITMTPQASYFEQLTKSFGYEQGPFHTDAEVLTKDEALASFREHERQGACHSIWTFGTPFIGGICNCDRSTECLAMHTTVTKGMPMMFRAEYVARVEPEKCNGCRLCMRTCPFGAVGYSLAQEKVTIYPKECYGCGICRTTCAKDAIALHARSSVPAAASVW